MNTVQAIRAFFLPIIAASPLLLYFGTYLSIIFFGNVVSFATILIAFQGGTGIWPFLGIISLVLLADISGDLAWYWLGRGLRGTRVGEFLYKNLPKHAEIERHILKRSDRWIFLSKYIPFSTFTIIFLSGWSIVPFKKFFKVSVAAVVSSVAALTLLVFLVSLGLSSLGPAAIFQRFERLLILGVLVFLLFNFLAARLSRRILRREDAD